MVRFVVTAFVVNIVLLLNFIQVTRETFVGKMGTLSFFIIYTKRDFVTSVLLASIEDKALPK